MTKLLDTPNWKLKPFFGQKKQPTYSQKHFVVSRDGCFFVPKPLIPSFTLSIPTNQATKKTNSTNMRCFFFASMPTLLSASSQHNSYPPQSSYKLDQNDNIFAKSLVDVIDAGGKKYYTVPTCWKSTIQVLRQWHLDHKEEDVSPPHSNSSFDFCSTLTEKDRKKVRKKDKSMPEVVVSKPVVAYQPSPRSWCTC